jgi:hypothetical protein
MPLPYQPPSQALMQLVGDMANTGMRIGGTSEQQVGEGKAEAPVGTTLAMIEQATKVMNAVHKRIHASQAAEFQLLVECFKEHPESFWQRKNASATPWDEEMFLQAVNNCELVPQADPNTASHGQRVMKIMALKQLQAANPSMYDPLAIDTAALQAIGWNNPQQFLAPKTAQAAPPPELQKVMAEIQVKKQSADAQTMSAQAKMKEVDAKIQSGAFAPRQEGLAGGSGMQQQDTQADLMAVEAKMMDAQTRREELTVKHAERDAEDKNRDFDRHSRERIQLLQLARDIMLHPEGAAAAEEQLGPIERALGAEGIE